MPLVENPAAVLRDYLEGLEVGVPATLTPGTDWQLTHGRMPPDGDRYITVYNDGDVPQGRIQRTGERVVKHRVLIRVRAPDEAAGRAKGKAIEAILDRVGVPEAEGGAGRRVTIESDGETYEMTNAMIVTPLTPAQPAPERRLLVFSLTAQLSLKLGG